jgi:hypothetical protein
MEDGGVDGSVIECWHHLLCQVADFPTLIIYSVSDLKKCNVLKIKTQMMPHTLMNLVITISFEKYVGP